MDESSGLSRREFLQKCALNAVALSALSSLPTLFAGCHADRNAPTDLQIMRETMEAFADRVVPPDPLAPGDKGGKALGLVEAVFEHFQRDLFIFNGLPEADVNRAASFYLLLNELSQERFAREFVELTPAEQDRLLEVEFQGRLERDVRDVLGLLFLEQLLLMKLAYYANYPESRVRDGAGNPVFSDAAGQISNPNIPGTGTAWDYLGYPGPIKKPTEDLLFRAYVDEDQAALTQLHRLDRDRQIP